MLLGVKASPPYDSSVYNWFASQQKRVEIAGNTSFPESNRQSALYVDRLVGCREKDERENELTNSWTTE
jgi:hypothetical protein